MSRLETILYRMPEVAHDRHQALEERWSTGVWLGHARDTSATLVATETGVINVWAIRRLAHGQRWDGYRNANSNGVAWEQAS